LIGAGAIINFLQGDKSPEAQIAQTAFDNVSSNLAQAIFPCASGKELIQRGFQTDVEIAVQFDVSQSAPLLQNGAYIDQHPAD
jgi:2-phosphosulfolactate phosphatase